MGQYITFRVGRQDFALEATRLRGLLPAHELISLDSPRGWICGIGSIRGHDFPVVDLRRKLSIAAGSHGRRPCIIVVGARGERLAGFVADRVSQVLDLRPPDIRSDHVRVNGRARRLLDADQIFGEGDLEDFCRMVAERQPRTEAR